MNRVRYSLLRKKPFSESVPKYLISKNVIKQLLIFFFQFSSLLFFQKLENMQFWKSFWFSKCSVFPFSSELIFVNGPKTFRFQKCWKAVFKFFWLLFFFFCNILHSRFFKNLRNTQSWKLSYGIWVCPILLYGVTISCNYFII